MYFYGWCLYASNFSRCTPKSHIGLLSVRQLLLIPNVACGASRLAVLLLRLRIHYMRSLAQYFRVQSTFAVGQELGTTQLRLTCLQCWLQIAYLAARTVSKHFLSHRCLVLARSMSRLSDADRPPAYTCQGVTYTLRGSSLAVATATTGRLPRCCRLSAFISQFLGLLYPHLNY